MPGSFGLICWLARLLLPSPSQPRTLHLALQANARPVQSRRAARREWRQQGRG